MKKFLSKVKKKFDISKILTTFVEPSDRNHKFKKVWHGI